MFIWIYAFFYASEKTQVMLNELSEAGFRVVLNAAEDREEDITKLQK